MNIAESPIKGDYMPAAFYTTKELADYLKLSEQTVRLWIKKGKVQSFKFEREHRIPESEVQRLVTEAQESAKEDVNQ